LSPVSYRYKKAVRGMAVGEFDAPYVINMVAREVGKPVLGMTETQDERIVFFDSELTPEQKAKLDSIMNNPPKPVRRYEYGIIDLEELIESELGVRPVRVNFDPRTNNITVDFDKDLTIEQEKKLEAILKSPHRLKRRK